MRSEACLHHRGGALNMHAALYSILYELNQLAGIYIAVAAASLMDSIEIPTPECAVEVLRLDAAVLYCP
jgi:hypothetical protein